MKTIAAEFPKDALTAIAADVADDLHLEQPSEETETLSGSFPGPESAVVAGRLEQLKAMTPEERAAHAQTIRDHFGKHVAEEKAFERLAKRVQRQRAALHTSDILKNYVLLPRDAPKA